MAQFKPKSTNKKAKNIIRNEALSRFSKDFGYDTNDRRTRLERMKDQADHANAGTNRRYVSDYEKAKYLVDGGMYEVYWDRQADFLAKIYGKDNVEKWSGNKVHDTYAHLIAREYQAMLREKNKKKSK